MDYSALHETRRGTLGTLRTPTHSYSLPTFPLPFRPSDRPEWLRGLAGTSRSVWDLGVGTKGPNGGLGARLDLPTLTTTTTSSFLHNVSIFLNNSAATRKISAPGSKSVGGALAFDWKVVQFRKWYRKKRKHTS